MTRWQQLDYYRKALLGMIPIASALLLFMLFAHPLDFLFANWFIDILIIPTFFGTLISSAGYLGRALDAVSSRPTAGFAERIGTCVGVICGALLGIGLVVLHKLVPFVNVLHSFADVVFTLFNISSLAGLGNRIGSFIDNNARPKVEKRAIALTSLLALGAGLALFFTNNAALVCIAGVTSFFTGGVALPFVVVGIIFATTFSSLFASSADYFSKAGSFLRAENSSDLSINKNVQERFHEYRGALAGVSTGFIVAAVIITALAITQPYIFVGIASLLVSAIILTACVSVLGGLFSRVGRLMDSRETVPMQAANTEKNDLERMQLIEPLNDRDASFSSPKSSRKVSITDEKEKIISSLATPSLIPSEPSNIEQMRDRVSTYALIKRASPPNAASLIDGGDDKSYLKHILSASK